MRFRHLHFLATFDNAEIPWKMLYQMEKVLTDENGPISNAELPINSIKTSPIRQEINEVNFKNAIKAANICMHYPIANVNQKSLQFHKSTTRAMLKPQRENCRANQKNFHGIH